MTLRVITPGKRLRSHELVIGPSRGSCAAQLHRNAIAAITSDAAARTCIRVDLPCPAAGTGRSPENGV